MFSKCNLSFHLQYVHEDLLQNASEESLVVHAAGATRVEVYKCLECTNEEEAGVDAEETGAMECEDSGSTRRAGTTGGNTVTV